VYLSDAGLQRAEAPLSKRFACHCERCGVLAGGECGAGVGAPKTWRDKRAFGVAQVKARAHG
jgi:hypothetical protein